MDINLEQLRDLMRAMADFQMSDVELEKAGERIVLKRGGGVIAVAHQPAPMAHAPSIPPAAAPAPAGGLPPVDAAPAEEEAGTQWITSPFVGTFYSAPSPDASVFVKVGQEISPGTVLCIVEAMKLMNEIESEISGEIVEIAATNGKPVEYGDRLFKIKAQ